MTSKITVVCCLMFSVLSIMELAASGRACNGMKDVTIYMDVSTRIDELSYVNEQHFVAQLIDTLLPTRNNFYVGVMFYAYRMRYATRPFFTTYDTKDRIKNPVLAKYGTYQLGDGDDILQAIINTNFDYWRQKKGTQRVALVIADAVVETWGRWYTLDQVKDNNVRIVAIAVGNNSTLKTLELYTDSIIKVESFWDLNLPQTMDKVLTVGRLC